MSKPNIAVVIPAGGGGTRLWPRSRQSTPKQFLDIVSRRTMLQETADRVEALIDPAQLFVITNARHVGPVREQLPEVPPENIVGEPQGRDSAPAIGLMAALIERVRGEDTVMVVLPADHVILRDKVFREIILEAAKAAEQGYLVTVGIHPTSPDTGFGYIQSAAPISDGSEALTVAQFREKPKREIAEEYLAQGGFYWNAGMFIATVKTLRALFQAHLPQSEAGFVAAAEALRAGDAEAFAEHFSTLEKISFDYAIAEKADKVAVVPADIGWNDVGSWTRLAEVLSHEKHVSENVVIGDHIGVDTTGSLIYSPHRLIATIGLEDIIVIDTPDATLICPKSRSEDVKQIVETLKARGAHDLL
ncbi:mannose-1-phosphate guanylyltransferase [Capsulimonas corticalis]|uniref:mannose-1-phosphate guanylyltransferase n=1 Tax=Capsulimonas corticalis TaxID=2219043 RepID=A0A402CVU3_9BACT|nr:mannose-1-phosphate guanylyltransferase [Capsulimonas corticalis]BDI30516.1 mannose-1-phosphate guanylyltransferase [Capsulimonas corticalis]